MAKHKTKEYEVRTVDQYGDAIDIVWTGPNTKKALAEAKALLPTFLGDDAVGVVLELAVHTSTDDVGYFGKIPKGDLCNDDLDYSPTIAWVGDEEALRNGGWIE